MNKNNVFKHNVQVKRQLNQIMFLKNVDKETREELVWSIATNLVKLSEEHKEIIDNFFLISEEDQKLFVQSEDILKLIFLEINKIYA